MASAGAPSSWDELPDEILLQIISYLEPHPITRLQLVSRKLQKLCLDDELWKNHCFDESAWYKKLQESRERAQLHGGHASQTQPSDEQSPQADAPETANENDPEARGSWACLAEDQRRTLDMANWDPAFPDEQVSWYDEYIQRCGPSSVNWLEFPRLRDRGFEALIEARGLALYDPYDGQDGEGSMFAVSPLDDGSVCLWDIAGSRGKQGSIVAKSEPGILFTDGPGDQNTMRSKRIDTGVTECVSVDSHNHRAFFAVQGHLIEVDLDRLQPVNRDFFEWSITTLSPVHNGVPLTVGTSLGIHLHDFRAKSAIRRDPIDRVDTPQWDGSDVFKSIFDPNPLPPYAPLSQPTPISILHLPKPGSRSLVSDDIYVSGRFSSILHYDRRKFPNIVGSIYSGASINSLAALPYPFSTLDHEIRGRGELSLPQLAQSKSNAGCSLIAGGTYKTKGSLEIYGLSPPEDATDAETIQCSTMKNRNAAASSSILSVANHGTKIVFSDGTGLLKWFERDGSTECRRLRIGHSDTFEQPSLFASMPAADDLARKIVSTKSSNERPNNDNILFWTGEKLGMVSFTTAPLFKPEHFEDDDMDEEAAAEEDKRKAYGEKMRTALERQADEVKFIGSLTAGRGGASNG